MSLSAWIVSLATLVAAPAAGDYFTISVVDEETGRGVPLVELRTVAGTVYVTDSAGLVAFFDPGLMNQPVFFHVASHGYEFPADGFGYHGKALRAVPGGSAELRVHRINVAERLYRVTGEGIYRDSVLLGRQAPLAAPLLNAQVVGSDSVNMALFRGKLYWFWGDTQRARYPLGNFHVPGATSLLPREGGLDPSQGVDLEYFQRDDGFAASTAQMPGAGPTWIDGLCVVRDARQGERLFAKYVKVRKLLEVYERGLVEFNDETRRFEKVAQFDFSAPLYPLGHSSSGTADGVEYVYFGNPHPLVRVRAHAEALADPRQYESFTCLKPGSRLEQPEIERDDSGVPQYGWKRDTALPSPRDEAAWRKSGLLKPGESILVLRDVESGATVVPHAGSVAWNEHRKRYVMIATEVGGASYLGEVWYAEADSPRGPWVYARKIVTHRQYSFYNPKHHVVFDQQEGRRICFEGTYSTTFSGSDTPTPRYDYNQIMYAFDLEDPRVVLPVAVYRRDDEFVFSASADAQDASIAFMALDRARGGAVPIVRRESADGSGELSIADAGTSSPHVVFYGLPADTPDAPQPTVPLFEWRNASGQTNYAVGGQAGPAGFVRAAKPLCLVWRYPITIAVRWQ